MEEVHHRSTTLLNSLQMCFEISLISLKLFSKFPEARIQRAPLQPMPVNNNSATKENTNTARSPPVVTK